MDCVAKLFGLVELSVCFWILYTDYIISKFLTLKKQQPCVDAPQKLLTTRFSLKEIHMKIKFLLGKSG